jgi:hypothetical protein
MTIGTCNRICKDNGVPLRDRPAMVRFALDKVKPRRASTLRRLLGYRTAIGVLIRELSTEYFRERRISFPPPGWKIGDPRPRQAA